MSWGIYTWCRLSPLQTQVFPVDADLVEIEKLNLSIDLPVLGLAPDTTIVPDLALDFS